MGQLHTRCWIAIAWSLLALSAVADDRKPTKELFDDFTAKTLDAEKWRISRRQWGGEGANGGVVPENVSLRDGKCVLQGNGDRYIGPVCGCTRTGRLDHGRRSGACIATKDYFASGSYEVRMKVAPRLGVCSSIWTFHYAEVGVGPGNSAKETGKRNGQIINHEIDIEIPGRPTLEFRDIGFDWALMNTWVGESGPESTIGHTKLPTSQADGQFHDYRIDWHTGGPQQPPSVDFYIDEQKLRTIATTVPTRAGRFWIGVWFPRDWAGAPDFDTTEMVVDWVRITPFHEPNDSYIAESYPNDGWVVPGPTGAKP